MIPIPHLVNLLSRTAKINISENTPIYVTGFNLIPKWEK